MQHTTRCAVSAPPAHAATMSDVAITPTDLCIKCPPSAQPNCRPECPIPVSLPKYGQNKSYDYEVRVSRQRQWSEDMTARFAAGTFTRIQQVLKESESKTDFVRGVERELKRRERK